MLSRGEAVGKLGLEVQQIQIKESINREWYLNIPVGYVACSLHLINSNRIELVPKVKILILNFSFFGFGFGLWFWLQICVGFCGMV